MELEHDRPDFSQGVGYLSVLQGENDPFFVGNTFSKVFDQLRLRAVALYSCLYHFWDLKYLALIFKISKLLSVTKRSMQVF